MLFPILHQFVSCFRFFLQLAFCVTTIQNLLCYIKSEKRKLRVYQDDKKLVSVGIDQR